MSAPLPAWGDRAGGHGERVHQAIVVQHQLDLQHVQADEVPAKGTGMIVWMAMARNGLQAAVGGRSGQPEP